MSFRQYGGTNYTARNNIVKNHYTNASNLSVMNKVGQPTSVINSDSDININGNLRISGVNADGDYNGIYFPDGSFQNIAGGGGGGTSFWTNINTDDIHNTNIGNVGIGTGVSNPNYKLTVNGNARISTALSVGNDTLLGGNLDVSGSSTINSLNAKSTIVTSLIASSTLNVTGATTLGSLLGVTGATTLGGSLSVTGATTLGGSLSVNGTSTSLNSLLTVNNTGTGSANVQITKSDMLLSGVPTPTSSNSVVTKQYVDDTALGYNIKTACQCATTDYIDLTAAQSIIDNVTITNGTRVLVWQQGSTYAVQNGIYVADDNNMLSRSDDLPYDYYAKNILVFVQGGTNNGKTSFLQNPAGVFVRVGVEPLYFAVFNYFDLSVGANLIFYNQELSVTSDLTGIDSITFSGNSGGTAGTQNAPFSTTGVSEGNYTNPDITVNKWGQITAASSGIGGSSYWTLLGNNLYPDTTNYNVCIGTTTNANPDKLLVQGSLRVNNGDTNLGGKLNVTGGLTTLSNGLTVSSGATNLGGTLSVTGATTLSSTLNVTGNLTVNGTINGTVNNANNVYVSANDYGAGPYYIPVTTATAIAANYYALNIYDGGPTYSFDNGELSCKLFRLTDNSSYITNNTGDLTISTNSLNGKSILFKPKNGTAALTIDTTNAATFANYVYATTFTGNLTGTASNATNANYATSAGSANTATNATNATNATSSTTQPTGTNNTTIATTAFVQKSLLYTYTYNNTNPTLSFENVYYISQSNSVIFLNNTTTPTAGLSIYLPNNSSTYPPFDGVVCRIRQIANKRSVTFTTGVGTIPIIGSYNNATCSNTSLTPAGGWYYYELLYSTTANGWFLLYSGQ